MLIKLAAIAAAGFVGYKYWEKKRGDAPAAFATGQGSAEAVNPVRDAGPDAMRDSPGRSWSETDEASDQSFPASDPPATY
ncbi:MAG: hypothetical protein IE933_04995 [Sphingomonadales bacterium]|nr:hypothetical protein [Sphingomonadales bacterium]MBD3774897.1 hypothetical protein [Paracoccaceae bacterium]